MWDNTAYRAKEPVDTQCRNCGAHVSSRFARVFGDNEDRLYACLECQTVVNLTEGAATEP